jgi:hypothetical protein
MFVLVSRTYTEYDEEALEAGHPSDTGFVYTDHPMRVKDAIRELEECSSVSCWPVTLATLTGHEWATTETIQSRAYWEDGIDRQESIHLRRMDGQPLKPRQLFRMYRAAGLTQ